MAAKKANRKAGTKSTKVARAKTSRRATVKTASRKVRRSAKTVRVAVKPRAAAKPSASSERIQRRSPETLRLRSFTPSLTVNDLPKSIAFYTDGLGFIIKERWADGDTLKGVMLKAGVSELGLSQDDWKLGQDRPKGAGFRLWCETVQSVDAIAARMKAAGFALIEEPTDHPEWQVRSISVDDPDGFHVTIAQDI